MVKWLRSFCGFNEVRRNAEGKHYCPCCGKVMPDDFETVIKLTLPKRFLEQLKKQCTPPEATDDR